MLFATGTGNNRRLLNLSTMANSLGPIASQLTALHPFSGCDTTSCFHGKGKKAVLAMIKKHENYLLTLSNLGHRYEINTIPEGLEMVVCQLYGTKARTVNEARHELFCRGGLQERNLPPNKDALLMHVKRANYQTKIWRSALSAMVNCSTPVGNGWVIEDRLAVHWLTEPYAPTSILKTQKCQCKTGCKSGRCLCVKSFLVCTDLCSCTNCENVRKQPRSSVEDDNDSDEDIDDAI